MQPALPGSPFSPDLGGNKRRGYRNEAENVLNQQKRPLADFWKASIQTKTRNRFL